MEKREGVRHFERKLGYRIEPALTKDHWIFQEIKRHIARTEERYEHFVPKQLQKDQGFRGKCKAIITQYGSEIWRGGTTCVAGDASYPRPLLWDDEKDQKRIIRWFHQLLLEKCRVFRSNRLDKKSKQRREAAAVTASSSTQLLAGSPPTNHTSPDTAQRASIDTGRGALRAHRRLDARVRRPTMKLRRNLDGSYSTVRDLDLHDAAAHSDPEDGDYLPSSHVTDNTYEEDDESTAATQGTPLPSSLGQGIIGSAEAGPSCLPQDNRARREPEDMSSSTDGCGTFQVVTTDYNEHRRDESTSSPAISTTEEPQRLPEPAFGQITPTTSDTHRHQTVRASARQSHEGSHNNGEAGPSATSSYVAPTAVMATFKYPAGRQPSVAVDNKDEPDSTQSTIVDQLKQSNEQSRRAIDGLMTQEQEHGASILAHHFNSGSRRAACDTSEIEQQPSASTGLEVSQRYLGTDRSHAEPQDISTPLQTGRSLQEVTELDSSEPVDSPMANDALQSNAIEEPSSPVGRYADRGNPDGLDGRSKCKEPARNDDPVCTNVPTHNENRIADATASSSRQDQTNDLAGTAAGPRQPMIVQWKRKGDEEATVALLTYWRHDFWTYLLTQHPSVLAGQSFHDPQAGQIRTTARDVMNNYGGSIAPDAMEECMHYLLDKAYGPNAGVQTDWDRFVVRFGA